MPFPQADRILEVGPRAVRRGAEHPYHPTRRREVGNRLGGGDEAVEVPRPSEERYAAVRSGRLECATAAHSKIDLHGLGVIPQVEVPSLGPVDARAVLGKSADGRGDRCARRRRGGPRQQVERLQPAGGPQVEVRRFGIALGRRQEDLRRVRSQRRAGREDDVGELGAGGRQRDLEALGGDGGVG